MIPFSPDPTELVSANLRRAYRGTPPDGLPDRFATLLSLIAAKSAAPEDQPQSPASRAAPTGNPIASRPSGTRILHAQIL